MVAGFLDSSQSPVKTVATCLRLVRLFAMATDLSSDGQHLQNSTILLGMVVEVAYRVLCCLHRPSFLHRVLHLVDKVDHYRRIYNLA
jgi:hypothetical protein